MKPRMSRVRKYNCMTDSYLKVRPLFQTTFLALHGGTSVGTKPPMKSTKKMTRHQ